jgi:1-deoxy-D-xylulose-5-phosphate synthase
MNNTPATLLVFGGGIYTSDYSHVSMYDIAMLSNIPNLVYLSPTCDAEYKMMLEFSKKAQFPIAIRVCQDDESEIDKRKIPPLEYQLNTVKQPKSLLKNTTAVYPNISFMLKPEIYQQGHDIVIVGLGKFFKKAVNVARIVKEKFGCEVTVINPRSITNVNFLFLSGALAIKSD